MKDLKTLEDNRIIEMNKNKTAQKQKQNKLKLKQIKTKENKLLEKKRKKNREDIRSYLRKLDQAQDETNESFDEKHEIQDETNETKDETILRQMRQQIIGRSIPDRRSMPVIGNCDGSLRVPENK